MFRHSKLFFTLLIIFLGNTSYTFAANGSFAGGSGSVGNPYQIEDCLDLQAMSSSLSSNYILNNNIDCSDTVNWNSGAGFNPIGGSSTQFTGTLNGNSKVISNLYIYRPSTSLYVGLFGYVTGSGSSITMVGLENVNITGQGRVGALAGQVWTNSSVTKSYVSGGTVTGTSIVGGLIGWRGSGTTSNLYSNVTVSATGNTVGGLMGAYSGGTTTSNLYSAGSVTGVDYVGGLVGETVGTSDIVNLSFTISSVTATSGSPSARGRFIGRSYANITNSRFYNVGIPSSCAGTVVSGSTAGCTGQNTLAYFQSTSNVPLSSWDFSTIWGINALYNNGYPYLAWQVFDSTAPTITSVSSDKTNGSYKAGEVIDIDVTFSEAVTSTGNVTVTLETGTTDRTCTFSVSNSSNGTCNYTVQAGDVSSDLEVSTISGTIADQASNVMNNFVPTTNLASNKAIIIDTTAPVISEVTAVTTPTSDTTPNYNFTTDEAGTISYGGSCSSATTSATVGTNTITFTTLADGTYSNCTIIVTDTATNASNTISVTSFTIDSTSPIISEITAVSTPSTNTTPSYSFTTDEAGTISYGGSCSSSTTSATVGTNTITFSTMASGTYSNCTIIVTDINANVSNTLSVSGFTISITPSGSVPLFILEAMNNVNNQIVNNLPIKNTEMVNGSSKFSFTKDQKLNNDNLEVKELQKFLNTKGYIVSKSGPGSVGNETTFFGPLTKKAVMRFQEKYFDEILKPLGNKTPTGYVGEYTRAKMNELITS